MLNNQRERLRGIRTFQSLIKYLRDELDWPIESEDFEDLTFEYTPDELGIDTKNAAKIQEIKRLRPLSVYQPWGIFFVKFEPKRLPVVALRRILGQVTLKKRASANSADRAAWSADDLLFISNYGEGDTRQINFAHFSQNKAKKDLPTLKILGWDNLDTPLHLDHVAEVLTECLVWPDNEDNTEEWRRQWRSAFTIVHREVITTSKRLSIELAKLARNIRYRINSILAIETEGGPVTKLMAVFKEYLIHDLDMDGFADMYAQTIAYGLLSARVANPSGTTADNFAIAMPTTNPFLKELLETFLDIGGRKSNAGQGSGLDFDELGVSEVVDLLDASNMEAVVLDFGDRNPQEDPIIHFYELFLKEYDAKKRMQRGVFYTPRPVVSFIVRSVDELLRTEFGLEDGLADTTTWEQMAKCNKDLVIPDGVSPDQDFIQILDPATGTGTFLVEVIDFIHKTMTEKWKAHGQCEKKLQALWNDYVPKHLLPRLHGYELLMAPYAIAHLKIGLKLYETGYRFVSDARAQVYLTNALEPPSDKQLTLDFLPALAHEAQAVNEIKRKQRFTVVIGNPPYSNFGRHNRIPAILNLLRDYKEGLQEKKLNLDDDFIKFLRFSQYCLDTTAEGLLGFITNNTFFDGITHRKMRESIRRSMSKVFVLDLHGSAAKKEKCPDGAPDSNVFDIQQGVGISLWLRRRIKKDFEAVVLHRDLWGMRQSKCDRLVADSLIGNSFARLSPQEPYHFFVPKDFDTGGEYRNWVSLTDIFNIYGSGIQTDRDELFIDHDKRELASRINMLFSPDGLSEPFRTKFRVENSSSFQLLERLRQRKFDVTSIRRCLYRPFDVRWLYYSPGLTSRPAWEIMKHMLPDRALGLLTMRQFEYDVPEPCYFLATNFVCERRVFISNRGAADCFPLYANMSGCLSKDSVRISNIRSSFLSEIANMAMKTHPNADQKWSISGEEAFRFIYSILHSSSYRRRYAGFLRIEYPRIPLPCCLDLLHHLERLGGELIALHLMESLRLNTHLTTLVSSGDLQVEKVSYSDETVWIDKAKTRGFRGVPEDVWNFYIGGYQVCEKWLKDRGPKKGNPGRSLTAKDIEHYQKIIVAINETIRIMAEIDEVIEAHGGWPGAFQTGEVTKETSEHLLKVAEPLDKYETTARQKK